MFLAFKQNDNFMMFHNNVWEHLKDTGMDTVAYLPTNPSERWTMINVVKWHARFTIKPATTVIEPQLDKYDISDKLNNQMAQTYLFVSLSTNLQSCIKDCAKEDDPFPIVWLHLLKVIQSLSIERFKDIKVSIK